MGEKSKFLEKEFEKRQQQKNAAIFLKKKKRLVSKKNGTFDLTDSIVELPDLY
mgnify:CR=1 FL=1